LTADQALAISISLRIQVLPNSSPKNHISPCFKWI
jgi:hypothetical protein